MTNKYAKLESVMNRLVGFAQAVRDLDELQKEFPKVTIQMPQEKLVQFLIVYANEYDMTKGLPNENTN